MGAGRRCSVGILQPERGPWRSIRVSLLGWAENTRTLFSGGPAYPLTLSFLLRGCPILTPPGSVTNPRPIRSSARSSDRRRSPGSASYPRSLHQPCTQARLALLWGPHASSLPPSLSPTLSSQLREQVDSTTVQPGASGGLPPPHVRPPVRGGRLGAPAARNGGLPLPRLPFPQHCLPPQLSLSEAGAQQGGGPGWGAKAGGSKTKRTEKPPLGTSPWPRSPAQGGTAAGKKGSSVSSHVCPLPAASPTHTLR